ncbi:aromatase/cyclase [Nocardiopsis valliformis]|uniref:aromatase/cyclase n=1 Tax=Nocardiopsis valliformis TaxID=239974 RepID=UPI00034524B9|nr:aromatase/cyclase [Nocardiopsis valliformis]
MSAAEHRMSHSITVESPAARVYQIISAVESWPLYFEPNIHVEVLTRGDTNERVRLWATANDEVKSWTSRRELDPEHLTVSFRQEVSQAPVASMGGEWRVVPVTDERCELWLDHDFTAVGGDPELTEWITRAVDRNSDSELGAVKSLAESGDGLAELEFSFEDTVRVDGAAADVMEFLDRADLWPTRLEHVSRLELSEDGAGVQRMSMDTRTADGSVHTTESVRVCLRDQDRIVYKQIRTPTLMRAHTGEWRIARAPGGGLDVTSRHSVIIRAEAVADVLGEEATVADARSFVHQALSRNSGVTLARAKEFAEGRSRSGSATASA